MPQLRFETKKMIGSDLGGESCVPDLLGESILQNRLTFSLDEDDEIYEGYGRRKNGGLVIDDIREGEDSISQLWSELSEKLWGEKKKVPYKYDFMAF